MADDRSDQRTEGRPAAWRAYVEAARPRTLPAALAPVLVGTAAAERAPDQLSPGRFLLALTVALALQVAVNYANDYFDGVGGIDTAERVGPRRAVAAGLIAPAAMRRATGVALLVAALAGLALAWQVGWWLLAVGALAILATLGYSGGSRPYASRGLGEVGVFVFFGLVATVGSQLVQDGAVRGVAVAAAVPVGLLAVALLVINNLRDLHTDTAVGKRTLAVRLGEHGTRWLFAGLIAGALVLVLPVVALAGSPWPLLAWLATPLAAGAVLTMRRAPIGPRLIGALAVTGRLQFAFGLLLALGLLLGAGATSAEQDGEQPAEEVAESEEAPDGAEVADATDGADGRPERLDRPPITAPKAVLERTAPW